MNQFAAKSEAQFKELRQIIELQQAIIIGDLNPHDLMKLVCQHTQELTKASGAVIEMQEGDEMIYTAGSGTLANVIGIRLKVASSLSGVAVTTNQVLQCDDSETDPRVDHEACRRVGAVSMICVPLVHKKNKPVGVLKVVAPVAHAFNQRCVDILQLLAGIVSASISHASEAAEKRRALELLQESETRLREAVEMKAQFLANMSHEIRTPINGVMGMAHMLLDTNLDSQQSQYTEIIRSSADSLLSLVNDILDFSKNEANKLALESVSFELRQVFDDIHRILFHTAEKKGLRFQYSIARDLPSHVIGDPSRVRQILCNLASNAIKFTSHGSVWMHVHGKSREDGSWQLRFEIQDCGIGIPKEALPRMFQPFSQVDSSTTRKFGGTGLGLSICKQLVDLMGGDIGVDSRESHGSTFWFAVTLKEGGSTAVTSEKEVTPETQASAQRLRLLVAEDNSVNQMIVSKMIEKLGHKATIVANGQEALEVLQLAPYDMVIMDCQMPELDGYEATRRIRQLSQENLRKIPVIAMTAHAMTGDREKCLECGMNDYVTKPTKIMDLRSAIERCLNLIIRN